MSLAGASLVQLNLCLYDNGKLVTFLAPQEQNMRDCLKTKKISVQPDRIF